MKKKKGTFANLMLYIKPLWGVLAAVVILSLMGSVFNVLIPNFTRGIVDETQKGITGTFDSKTTLNYMFTTLLLMGAMFLCGLLQSFISPLLSQRTAQRMRKQINLKSNRIPLNYFDTTPEGEVLSTMTNDIDVLSSSFSSTLPAFVTSVATVTGCIVMMLLTSPALAVTTIISTIIGLALTALVISKGQPYFMSNQNLVAKLNARVNEDIKGHLIIKSFNAENEVTDAFDEINGALFESTWKSQLVSSLMIPLGLMTNNLSYIAVCVVGAFMVISGDIGIGTVVAFIQFAQIFASPVSQISQAAGSIQPALAAGNRIFAMMEQDEMSDEGITKASAENVKGEVIFDHVKFGYNPENIIVHDFSCHVKPGQKVAIVGPTGAGKSTLINLLSRFYEVNAGDIRIDGVSIYDMSREDLHNMISMVLQETWTFQGSLRENIVYTKKGVTDEQLMDVVEKCGLGDFVRLSADGLDTVLAEEADISAGQKQLITIARAMLDDAPILILDEATSSVDTRTEKVISEAVDKLMEGRTSFVIAHRLSTIQNANLILVLKDGDIIETGTHEELMVKKGFYADLYMSQFDNQ
ncbi:MAG: ABC transporter ATP-binding protein/permease [Lachnospiraceae bacterium]|nr:ABC transporter ATP-binding protein/permease [Lachnospiraceae bacterium]